MESMSDNFYPISSQKSMTLGNRLKSTFSSMKPVLMHGSVKDLFKPLPSPFLWDLIVEVKKIGGLSCDAFFFVVNLMILDIFTKKIGALVSKKIGHKGS